MARLFDYIKTALPKPDDQKAPSTSNHMREYPTFFIKQDLLY